MPERPVMAFIEHRYEPTSANAVPADRRQASGEGKVGGPCHATKSDGYFCSQPAIVVADGHGWCARHRPSVARCSDLWQEAECIAAERGTAAAVDHIEQAGFRVTHSDGAALNARAHRV